MAKLLEAIIAQRFNAGIRNVIRFESGRTKGTVLPSTRRIRDTIATGKELGGGRVRRSPRRVSDRTGGYWNWQAEHLRYKGKEAVEKKPRSATLRASYGKDGLD